MGLAAPRNKTKISADPRNTHWATNTTRFGHRMLTSHGWQPGSALGDTSSAYHKSGHISEASNAGVKIVMKGDNLGIGCKAASQRDESIGLDAFQDLLGRLNGKAEEDIKKDGEVRMKLMVQGRYGMKFVKGETYCSSDIEKLREEIRLVAEEKECKAVKEGMAREGGKADKRVRQKGRKKLGECQDEASSPLTSPDPAGEATRKRKDKKRDKKKGKKSSKDKLSSPTPTPSSADNTDSIPNSKPKKRKRAGDDSRKVKDDDRKKRPKHSSETSTLMQPDAPLTGRHAVRHRYIAAKRSAVMDAKALNEILMIKA